MDVHLLNLYRHVFERNCRRQFLQKTNEGEWENIMNEKLQIIFGLLGGLAVFIYGMNMMSECLQKAAGEKMKSILALLTKNPVLGVIAGALTTALFNLLGNGCTVLS